jgi:hypothetical protein
MNETTGELRSLTIALLANAKALRTAGKAAHERGRLLKDLVHCIATGPLLLASPHRLGVAPGPIQVSLQHVQAIAQRIRADAFRLRRKRPAPPPGLPALRRPPRAVRRGQRARSRPPMPDQSVQRARGVRLAASKLRKRASSALVIHTPPALSLRAIHAANRAGRPAADHHPTHPAMSPTIAPVGRATPGIPPSDVPLPRQVPE